MLAAIFLEIVPETSEFDHCKARIGGSEGIIFPMTWLLAGYSPDSTF